MCVIDSTFASLYLLTYLTEVSCNKMYVFPIIQDSRFIKVILYSYLILTKMNERITDN